VAWERVDVGHELGGLGGGGGAADSAGEEDGLAGDLRRVSTSVCLW
jgi:hypothetical protein